MRLSQLFRIFNIVNHETVNAIYYIVLNKKAVVLGQTGIWDTPYLDQ
jgi:hypothetical protein